MSGLRRITKAFGGIVVQGTHYVWDYVADEAVPESDMPTGSERWKASEAKRWESARDRMLKQLSTEADAKP